MKKLFLPLAIVLLALASSLRSSAQMDVGDSLALVDLYNSTGGPNWVNHTNWLTSKPVNTWFGINPNDTTRVEYLQLQNNNLVGTLPASIGHWTTMGVIDLSYNRISGQIPSTITNFAYKVLNLNHNQLSGTLPQLSFDWLAQLDISYNNYTFETLEPASVGLSTILTDSIQADLPLIRQGNTLAIAAGGTPSYNTYTWYKDGVLIATKTGDSTYTTTDAGNYSVSVTNSRVPGLTLYSIQNTNTQDSLSLIDLYNNTAGPSWINNTGWTTSTPVSTWYGVTTRLGRVTELNFQGNNMSGSIPATVGNLQSAVRLNFYVNHLSGSIPSSLGNLSSLRTLTLDSNQLSGSIPATLGNLTSVLLLDLGANQLTGSIPSSLGNMTNVGELFLEGNQLSGAIPQELGNLKNVTHIVLSRNQLSDTIPSTIANCTLLTDFDADNNQLTGNIPVSIARMQSFATLALNDNHLTGSIPDSFSYMPNLSYLELYDNQLTGTIPDSLGNAPYLTVIDVHNNNLSGAIKADFSKLRYVDLEISGNQYTYSAFPIPLPTPNTYIYTPQQPVTLTRVESTLSVATGGNSANSTYTLFKDGTLVATQTGDSAFSIGSLGNYNIVTTNPIAPLLTLYSDTLKLGLVLPDSSITTTQTITGSTITDINTSIFQLAAITPTTLMGNVTTLETIDPSIQTYNGAPYVRRHYDITPASNPTTSQATITLYFTQGDFDTYNAYVTTNNLSIPLLPTGGIDNGNVIITQYHGSFTGTSSPGNYSQGYQIITPTVAWDAIDNWWTVTFPVSGFSGFFLSSGSTPLPLTLLQFTGEPRGYSIDLQWETTDEVNTRTFTVQKSPDGVAFTPIGSVPAKNNLGQHDYGFSDTDPLVGNNFYRLKMQDIDGSFTYSSIVQVTMSAPVSDYQAYPNPASNSTTLLFNAERAAPYTIQITDMNGKQIATLAGSSAPGLNKVDLSLQGYAAGAYTITLTDEEHGHRSIRLIKK